MFNNIELCMNPLAEGEVLHTVVTDDAEGTSGVGVATIWKWYLGFYSLRSVTRHCDPDNDVGHNCAVVG
jgi:hypothetical protein